MLWRTDGARDLFEECRNSTKACIKIRTKGDRTMNCDWTCQNCSGSAFKEHQYMYHVESDKRYLKADRIRVCLSCGYGESLPKTNKSSLNEYYEKVYRSKGHPHYTTRVNPYITDRSISQLGFLSNQVELKETNAILEVGPGEGTFGKTARKYWPNLKMFCIEKDKSVRSLLEDAGYIVVDSANKISSEIDVVFSSHCLEHFSYLEDFFSIVSEARPKLGVFIEVPNCTSLYYEGRPYDSPHLLFFTKKSLEEIMKKNIRSNLVTVKSCGHSVERSTRNMKQSKSWVERRWSLGRLMYRLPAVLTSKILQAWSILRFAKNIEKTNASIDEQSYLYSEDTGWALRGFACTKKLYV